MENLAFVLLTMLFFGIAPVLEKQALVDLSPLLAVAVRSFAVSTILLVGLGATGRLSGLAQVDWKTFLFIVGGGLLGSLIGQWTYFKALRSDVASRIVPMVAAYPLVTVLVAATLLREPITWQKVLGTLMVVVGIALLKT